MYLQQDYTFQPDEMTLSTKAKPFRILIADDDEEDVLLAKELFDLHQLPVVVNDVPDGQYLMDFLKHQGEYREVKELPQLIILDLNMPRKNGFEALKEIKQDAVFCKIPVVVLSTSKTTTDIEKAYCLGANCFVTKPNRIDDWTDTINHLGRFWIECAVIS
jgi:two-component system, chemotaxis family, response regulator Rcp1